MRKNCGSKGKAGMKAGKYDAKAGKDAKSGKDMKAMMMAKMKKK